MEREQLYPIPQQHHAFLFKAWQPNNQRTNGSLHLKKILGGQYDIIPGVSIAHTTPSKYPYIITKTIVVPFEFQWPFYTRISCGETSISTSTSSLRISILSHATVYRVLKKSPAHYQVHGCTSSRPKSSRQRGIRCLRRHRPECSFFLKTKRNSEKNIRTILQERTPQHFSQQKTFNFFCYMMY